MSNFESSLRIVTNLYFCEAKKMKIIQATSEQKLWISLETRVITFLLDSEEQAFLNPTLGIEIFLPKHILAVPYIIFFMAAMVLPYASSVFVCNCLYELNNEYLTL